MASQRLLRFASRGVRRGESGQMLVTIALSSVFIMMVLGIALEAGFVWMERRHLQNVADAAALAGAQRLPEEPGDAVAEAEAWAVKNDAALSSNVATIEDDGTAVRSVVKKNASTILGSIIGFGGMEVTAKAKARVAGTLIPGPGVVPLAIDEDTYEECIDDGECTGVTLKEYSGNNDDPPSSYGLLDLGGTGGGANEVCEYLIGGADVGITDPTDEKTGNVSSLHNCLDQRLDAAQARGCLDEDDVAPGGVLSSFCNPLYEAGRGAQSGYPNAQPTAAIVIPVISSFEKPRNQGDCTGGSHCLDIIGADPEYRKFAIFLINADATVYGDDPTCVDSGQCWITGSFIQEWEAPVSTHFDLPTGDFDPDQSLLKIVQLVE